MSDPVLTDIELVVIALARSDPLSSLTRRRSLVRQIFGDNVRQELASPRLEALRRYAILRRVHGTTLPETERGRLRESGFDDPQTNEIDRLIAAQNPARGISPNGTIHSTTRRRGAPPAGR